MSTRRTPRRRGRPGMLTPDRIDIIARVLGVGVSVGDAAAAVGIARGTLSRWLSRGRDAAEAREDGERALAADDPYVELYMRAAQARARMALQAVKGIMDAGMGRIVVQEQVRTWIDPEMGVEVTQRQTRYLRAQWRALAWWLARTYPEDYGPNSKSFDQQLDEYEAQHAVGVPTRSSASDMASLAERLAATLALHDDPAPVPVLGAVESVS
ncbi:helix-turn-helix domain-containing protein [Streptomyces sp. NPDC054797]